MPTSPPPSSSYFFFDKCIHTNAHGKPIAIPKMRERRKVRELSLYPPPELVHSSHVPRERQMVKMVDHSVPSTKKAKWLLVIVPNVAQHCPTPSQRTTATEHASATVPGSGVSA